jgi:hypothetical protein
MVQHTEIQAFLVEWITFWFYWSLSLTKVFLDSSCSDNSCIDRTRDDDSSTPTSSKLLQLYQRRNQQLRATETRGSIANDFSAEILREIYGKQENREKIERFDSETPVVTMQMPRASGSGKYLQLLLLLCCCCCCYYYCCRCCLGAFTFCLF